MIHLLHVACWHHFVDCSNLKSNFFQFVPEASYNPKNKMKTFVLSFISILTLVTYHIPSSTSLPFIVIHGIGQDCSDKQVSELTKQLSHWSATEGYCIESSHGRLSSWLLPLMDQAAIACDKVKQMKELNQGYNIVGLSQGNLIARSLIEFCDEAPKVKNFISLGGPHDGVGSAPFGLFSMVYSTATKLINFDIYKKFVQQNLAASSYFKIPNTKLYNEDWIGLKALEEAGKVKYVALPGDHLEILEEDVKKYIVPYLKYTNSILHDAITPRILFPNLKMILLRLKRQCPKGMKVIRR